ncbi:MAG: tryptophan--tRNA ligase [Zetaproteobacteria bacterium]|nr:tryptophan--tRNA ligase [Zetaproteobacteria bacterium]
MTQANAATPTNVMLSAIQPTSQLTLGNYLGAIQNWVQLQDKYNCYFFAVDQHAITVRQNPEALRQATLTALATYVAAGVDPQRSTLFVQSHVPEHTQLCWILNCYSYMGELNRMTQYKDKSAKSGENIPAGLFTYPVLMAADILLYDAKLVPVGQDQKQHVELTRNLAQRLNNLYGDHLFVIPDCYIGSKAAKVMDLQQPTRKMSKSAENTMGTLFLMDDEKTILKKFKKAVTDSDTVIEWDKERKPGVANLIEIQSAITHTSPEEIVHNYTGKMYGHLKVETAEIVLQTLRPLQQKVHQLMEERTELEKILRHGAEKAREHAATTLKRVHDAVGFYT